MIGAPPPRRHPFARVLLATGGVFLAELALWSFGVNVTPFVLEPVFAILEWMLAGPGMTIRDSSMAPFVLGVAIFFGLHLALGGVVVGIASAWRARSGQPTAVGRDGTGRID